MPEPRKARTSVADALARRAVIDSSATKAPDPFPARRERTSKITVIVAEETNRRLRMAAIEDGTTVSDLVRDWVEDYLGGR